MAIWRLGTTSPNYGTPAQRRAAVVELRADKAADRDRAEQHILDGPADTREFWASRVATLTDELGQIDTALSASEVSR